VSPTDAGERLLRTIGPRFEEVDAELEAVTVLREKPAGTSRLTATENAAVSVLWPALERFLPNYPDIKVETVIDYGPTDIVAERFDAGVRFGETVASGIISVRIAPDARMAVVGSPSYFAEYKTPKIPQDLTAHRCINLRLPMHGGLYAWEFEKAEREMNVRVDGQLVFGASALLLTAARGLRPRLSDRRTDSRRPEKRPSGPRARRLVPALFRIPPLLPKPSSADASLRPAG
jgi:DNA-binding transcriptional LysR family regulator